MMAVRVLYRYHARIVPTYRTLFTTNDTYHTEYILATLATFVTTILCLGTNPYKEIIVEISIEILVSRHTYIVFRAFHF